MDEHIVDLLADDSVPTGYPNSSGIWRAALNATDSINTTLDSCGRPQNYLFTNVYHESIWLTRVSFPIFLLIGTIGNVIGTVLVVNERHDGRRRGDRALDTSRSRKVFLLALFISDLCYLWNRLIYLIGIGLWNLNPEAKEMYNAFFMMTHGIWSFLDSVLSFSSQGLLVVFCIDRYHALTSPLKHNTSNTFRRKTSIIVVGMIYTGTAICSLILPVLYYYFKHHQKIKPNAPVPQPPPALIRWRIFDAWLELVIRIGSVLTIIVLNRVIYVKLKKSQVTLAAHFESSNSERDAELRNVMSGVRSRTSKSAVMILMCSSVFYVVTYSLDIAMSTITVLSIYPVCLMQHAPRTLTGIEPAVDFLRHLYFAFGFIFYVWLKLKFRESFRRRRPFFREALHC